MTAEFYYRCRNSLSNYYLEIYSAQRFYVTLISTRGRINVKDVAFCIVRLHCRVLHRKTQLHLYLH